MTYYITFCACHNGRILQKYFLKNLLQKVSVTFGSDVALLYRVFCAPSQKGFRPLSKEYGNLETNVNFYSVAHAQQFFTHTPLGRIK